MAAMICEAAPRLSDADWAGMVEQERNRRNAGNSLQDVAASRAFLASVGFA